MGRFQTWSHDVKAIAEMHLFFFKVHKYEDVLICFYLQDHKTRRRLFVLCLSRLVDGP